MRYQISMYAPGTSLFAGAILTKTGKVRTFKTFCKALKEAQKRNLAPGARHAFGAEEYQPKAKPQPKRGDRKPAYSLRTLEQCGYAVLEYCNAAARQNRCGHTIRYVSRHHAKALAIFNRFEQGEIG